MASPGPEQATLTIQPSPGRASLPPGRSYLLVFEEGSCAEFPLPQLGEIVVGRAQEADLRLRDTSTSRRHALLTVAGDGVRVEDLESHNGTRVNGERLAGPRLLLSGDVVTICGVTLVFHRDARPPEGRPLLSTGQLRLRFEEEIERALHYHRPVTHLCLQLGPRPDRALAAAALAGQLRVIDAAAWGPAPGELLVLLPETDGAEAQPIARRLLRALSAVAPEGRAGQAVCPTDGCDVDTLFVSAAAAAAAAAPGHVATAGADATSFAVGPVTLHLADPAMVRLYELLRRLAQSTLPVLIHGETGAGKEIAAMAIHHWSPRKDAPLRTLNCAALPEGLVESELFGHERGAFSGAVASKPGLLEAAHGGTLFLDEIGELPLLTQAKLLRVLETGLLTRVGDLRERSVDLRVVAASNRQLEGEVAAGRFRQDLFFRLGAAQVALPPLRDRPRDLPLLAQALLKEACARAGRPALPLSREAMQRLFAHRWPGNVRELRNAMDYAVATSVAEDDSIEPWHLPQALCAGPAPAEADAGAQEAPAPSAQRFRPLDEEVRELERSRMLQALRAAGGVKTRAAELIGMPLRTYVAKLKLYQLAAPARDG